MSSFCLFGGDEGYLDPRGGFHVIIFGGAEFKRPTVARQLIEFQHGHGGQPTRAHCTILTVFGGGSVIWPTLAEEYAALRDALDSKKISLTDWDTNVGRFSDTGPLRIHNVTIFGGFDTADLPSEDDEVEAISVQRHLGRVPEEAVEALMFGVGQDGSSRLGAVRQAVGLTHVAG